MKIYVDPDTAIKMHQYKLIDMEIDPIKLRQGIPGTVMIGSHKFTVRIK